MKNIIKNSYLGVVGLAFFVVNIVAMRMTPQQMERAKVATQNVMTQMKEREKQLKRESMRKAGMYFIYENGTDKGVIVDKIVVQMCKSLANMIEDLGGDVNEIPLSFPVDTIKFGFDLLSGTTDISKLSSEQLIDVANLFNFLDVPAAKMQTVLVEIKKHIESNPKDVVSNVTLKKLNPDVQKLMMTDSTIDCLKDCIIKKYIKSRGKPFEHSTSSMMSVAFSPDGKKIASGSIGRHYSFHLWNNGVSNNTVWTAPVGHLGSVISVAFGPDSEYVITSGMSGANNTDLILWYIDDLRNITHQVLVGVQDKFNSVAFSPDGKKVFSLGDNFIVWDISNPDNIIHQQLLTDLGNLDPVIFSPDGKLVASIKDFSNFVIWDVSGPSPIPYKPVGQQDFGKIYQLAFSPDGKTVISFGHQFLLWDVSDLKNIKNRTLFSVLDLINDIPGYVVTSLIFSHDGKKIALGHKDGFILLDINNPNNRIVVNNIGMQVWSMAFSLDGRQIVTGGEATGMFGKNLILWTLITYQEDWLLNQIKNYNADQVRLIYQLSLQSSKKQSIELKKGSEEEAIFKTLPADMQKLLTDLFLPQGWLFGWWK